MESRRSIYHKNNTMKPHIGQKCKDAVHEHNGERVFEFDENGDRLRNPNKHIPKQVAALKCLWCGRPFKEYRVVCPYCNNCQYCGFYSPALNQCLHCGNQAPNDLKIKEKKIDVREIKKGKRH